MYKGINQDVTPDKLQDGLYFYAKNIVISDHLGSAVNELGNQFIDSISKDKSKTSFILGLYSIEDIVVVFSVTKDNFDSNFDDSFGDSVIGVFYNNVYTEIQGIRTYDWAFSTYFPIQSAGHKNNKEEFIIGFTDEFNLPRIINIGKKDNFTLEALNENETYMFPYAKVANVIVSTIEQGGNLLSGMYFVSYIYEDSQGNSVKGFNVSNGVAITRDAVSVGNADYNGVAANTETNKSLKIVINDIDVNYKFISFYIIQVIDGVTSVIVTEKQPITSSNIEKIFTGSETSYDASIEEVLIGNAFYTKARTITAHNKALYIGNLEVEEEINLQPFVNNIQVNPVSTLIDVTNLTNNQKTQTIRGFMHDEVYALYIRFWVKGKPTRVYHLPGREAVTGEKLIVDGNPFYIKNDTSFSGGFSSMGLWENINEPYPLEGGFPTGNVRHHKFPSINKCKDVFYQSEANYGKTKLDVLGIEVNFTQVLPIEFDSWEILYAKRENGTTIGTDLLLYAGNREGDVDAIWTTAGNWDVAATQAGSGDWDDMYLRQDYIRLHNFELLYTNTSRIPDYLKVIAKLRKPNLNDYFQNNGKEAGRITVSGDTNNNNSDGIDEPKTSAVIDYTSNNSSVIWNFSVTSSNLTEQLYVENNLVSNNYLNFFGEKTIVSKLETYVPILKDTINTNSPNQNTGELFVGSGFEETYLISLHYLKTDVYVNFYRQQLVSTGQVNKTSAIIYGGDTFVGEYSFITTTSINGDIRNTNEEKGIIIYRNSIAESIYNLGLRNEGNGEKALAYYPVTDVVEFNKGLSLLQPLNVIGYNKDYSSLNIFVSSDIFNPYEEFQNKFPYRIARSEIQTNETVNLLWKTWKANNYYEAEKSAGEITNLASFFGRLLIHHYYRLYSTVDKTTLETTNGIIALGAGDIFRLIPESITGEQTDYAGSQQTHTPFIFKGGYCFVDSLQGKVFVLTPGLTLEEISNTGLKKFFEAYLPVLDSSFKSSTSSFWVKPNIEKGQLNVEIPLIQGNFIPIVDSFLYCVTTDTTYTIQFIVKTYTHYICTLDLTKEELVKLKNFEYLEFTLEGLIQAQSKISVDNKYQDSGYALGYDELFNRLVLSKNVKNNRYLITTTKKKKLKYSVTVPITTVVEVECQNTTIKTNSNGGAGITDYKISNWDSDSPLVCLFDPRLQMDKMEILVDTGSGYEVVATSSVFAEGNYGVTSVPVAETATYPTTVNYIQLPVQGFDANTGLGVNGGDIALLPFSSITNVLFDEIRFLNEGAIDAPFESRPADSVDYTPPYNPYYVGKALNIIPTRYVQCKADLATIGYDLDSSPDAQGITFGKQLVYVKSIPRGASVVVRISGFLNTGWFFDILQITKKTSCTDVTIVYETQNIEIETNVKEYEIKEFCFTNSEYINGKLIKSDCGLLTNYYHLGLVLDSNNKPKKLLLQGNLQENSLEIIYCCPESAPEITAEWEDPVCITETVAGEPKPFAVGNGLISGVTQIFSILFFNTDQYNTVNPSVNDVIEITYEWLGVFTTITKTVFRVLGGISMDMTPPISIAANSANIGTMAHISVTNLTKGTPIVKGGRINSTEGSGFALTGFSAFKNLITNDGEIFTIPYPATAQEIADIVGIDLDYAQDLVEDRVNLDTDNCFPPTLKKSTQTIHSRGEDTVKTIIITGQGVHDLEIIPLFNTPVSSYKLEGEDLTLAEIQDSIDFNFVPNSTQTYEIEITTSNYGTLSKEAIYMAKYNEQGGASFPYDINVGFGVQLVSKDTFLAFDEFVFVAAISGNGWYANVRVNDTDFVTFPLKTLSDLNQAIGLVPSETLYTIHFYLTEPIVVTINDKPTSITKQYIAFSDRGIDIKTALYLPSESYNLEFVNPANLSFKMTDGDVLKTDTIWNSLTFKTMTEIRNQFGNGNKTILVQNNTVGYTRAYNAFLFNSEDPYVNVSFDFTYKEFYIPREISELTFDFTNATVTLREDNIAAFKTPITSLVDIQNWFTINTVAWAILEVSATLPKTIKLR